MLKEILKDIRMLDLIASKRVDSLFAGNYRSAFHGRGIEFADIREYDENDAFRDIDWATTAKQGKLYVKKYHESRELPAIAIVDTSAGMLFDSHGKSKGHAALEIIAILGFSALKNNDPFGAILIDKKTQQIFPPKKGHGHLWKILTSAAKILLLPPQKSPHESNIAHGVKIFQKRFKVHSAGFLVTDQVDLENSELLQAIKIARKRHEIAPFFIHDPIEREMPNTGFFSAQKIGGRKNTTLYFSEKEQNQYALLRKKKFENRKRILRKNGIESITLFSDRSITRELLLFFKRQEIRQ